MIEGFTLPKATFRTRAFDESKMEHYWLDKTTDDYLKHFGISNLNEMPTPDEVTELVESEDLS